MQTLLRIGQQGGCSIAGGVDIKPAIVIFGVPKRGVQTVGVMLVAKIVSGGPYDVGDCFQTTIGAEVIFRHFVRLVQSGNRFCEASQEKTRLTFVEQRVVQTQDTVYLSHVALRFFRIFQCFLKGSDRQGADSSDSVDQRSAAGI